MVNGAPRVILRLITSTLGGTKTVEVDVTRVVRDLPKLDGTVVLRVHRSPGPNGRYIAFDVNDDPDGTFNPGTNRPEQPKPPAKEDESQPSTSPPFVPTVQWTAAAQSVAEGVITQVTAQLSAATTADVAVPFTISGTAASGTDFTVAPVPNSLTIPAGSTSASVTVTVIDDGAPELDETIIFTLGTPSGGNLGPTTVHTVTITGAGEVAPSVTANTPADNAANVGIQSNLAITFSEPVTLSGNWLRVVCTVSGTRNVSDTSVTGGPTTSTVNPNADFTPGESCTATVFAAQVADQDALDPPDEMAANHAFTFTTEAAPTVTETVPNNGATDVAITSNITVTFSEPVTVTAASFTVECPAGTPFAGGFAVSGSGTATATINPTGNLPAGTSCQVEVIGSNVSDADDGDPPDQMAADVTFTFTTAPDPAPTVTEITPANGATGVQTDTTITINFSEPVDITSAANFSLVCDSNPQGYTVTVPVVLPASTSVVVIDPASSLPYDTTCAFTVFAAQVVDTDTDDPPDNMAADFTSTFTTAGPPP